jgi:hypothetical protein
MRDKIKKINELCRKDGTYKNDKGQSTVSLWSKIKYFRQVFGDELGIDTSVMEYEDYYICKCKIVAYDPERVLATGHHKQFKKRNATYIQGALPMSESFAISRALSVFGILDSDITSLEEYNMLGIPMTKETKGAANGSTNKGVDQIINEFKKCRNIYEYRDCVRKNDPYIESALTKHPSTYKAIMNVVENVQDKLNKQENI